MKNRFNPHGKFRFKLSNNTLISDAVGPWNKQGLQYAYQAIEECVAERKEKYYGGVTIVREVGVYTPDAAAFAQEAIASRAKAGGCCVALLYMNGEAAQISSLQLMALYRAHDIDAEAFREPETAIRWLEERGFTLESPSDLYDWL